MDETGAPEDARNQHGQIKAQAAAPGEARRKRKRFKHGRLRGAHCVPSVPAAVPWNGGKRQWLRPPKPPDPRIKAARSNFRVISVSL
ncbi:hypothetical protein PPGU16_22420 [Paraburkholderia largidicola]|uniref:Uncharacterized protein n=1 Tax=Paraburkholderia largidicola TaxID=3014751 RepID=A0A7I8BKY4_9BURK|nr:hypothetical protein PPGU16_22420 [Paraburkholderia sp. PGU16]